VKFKFNVGDEVMVKNDLVVGETYYSPNGKSDVFTFKMEKFAGEIATVIEVNEVGYRLDIDPIHTYTEEMLEPVYTHENDFNKDYATMVFLNSRLEFLRRKIDKALDNKMFEKNPKEFKKLVDEYKYLYDKVN